MSLKENKAAPRAGFTLVEVLIALVVAGLFLGVLGRAFTTAWGATHTPQETVAMMTIARAVAQVDAPGALPPDGRTGGYSFRRTAASVNIETRPSQLAPAPAGAGPASGSGANAPGMPVPVDTMPGVSDVTPATASSAPAAAPRQLRWISVVVIGLSGRRTSIETIKLDATPN